MDTVSGKAAELPIGLFDSGVGGLTVLAALRKRLPQEHYCYLGDTARLPYGTKSSSTIVRYSLQATQKLVERRIKLLVVACNTATAAALPELRKAYAPLPVVGVIEPGARAACKAVKDKPDGGKIIVMATESTVQGAAYTRAIQALMPDAEVTGVPCSLFVSLAEEGWMNGPIAEAIAERYLAPALAGTRPDCIVLGCTHFPPLAQAIASVAGENVVLVDSAATTAEAVEQELKRLDLLRPDAIDSKGGHEETPFDRLHFLTTDAPERFARVGSLFLDMDIAPEQLELVTL
ncbi:MAG: glutamate racemase [Desulfovibrionaceae bacterium]|nr:glutamate racemase [Desulfovibrionaceae bacterium]